MQTTAWGIQGKEGLTGKLRKSSPLQQILGPDFVEAPAEEGVYGMSAGVTEAQDGVVLHIQGYQMNQRAIRIIENRMKKDIPVLIQEAQEHVFAEGVISEIETDDAGSVRKIFVQGDDKQDSAHVSIAGYTQIFREGQQPKTAYGPEVPNISQEIKVEIVGAALMTLPPQASASTITIQSD